MLRTALQFMLKIDVIAVGRLRKGGYFDLMQEFSKRITWSLDIFEVESKIKDARAAQIEETKKLLQHVKDSAYIMALDEHGKELRSLEFSRTLENLQNTGQQHIQFIIGGADGLHDDIKVRAHKMLSLGKATWPHMLARVMLLEQIYRAQQILAGHPYHRE